MASWLACESLTCDFPLRKSRLEDIILEQVRKEFSKFKRSVLLFCKLAPCRNGSNCYSTHGRECFYLSLLSAISNNDARHFNWLLRKMLNVLPPARIELSGCCSVREDFDKAPLSRISGFCVLPPFNKSNMLASLLHYAVLCCSTDIVADLIPKVQDVSMSNEEWYPFLPLGFSSTPLWLAAFQQQPHIMSLLLNAGASPYEVCNVGYPLCHGYRRTVFTTCENHLPSREVLQSSGAMHRQFPIPLHVVAPLGGRGREWAVDIFESAFRWTSIVAVERPVLQDLVLSMALRPFLKLPCHSEEDILHKQTLCTAMLMDTLLWYWDACHLGLIWLRRLPAAIRDLVRHGALVCGLTVASRRYMAHRQSNFLWRDGVGCLYPSALPRPGEIPSSREVLPALLASCASFHFQLPSRSTASNRFDVEYPADTGSRMSQVTLGMPCFWITLAKAQSLDDPVIRELFRCGALPHVTSLECVPFSASDQKLHDGPTCQCEGVELSAQQRNMSVIYLLTANAVSSLQARCRAIIIKSCQGHGVVPAIRRLPLPSKVIDYLLYHSRRGNSLFRH